MSWSTMKMVFKAQTYLSESEAEPSSNISSTMSGSMYSFSTLEDDSLHFFRNMDLNTPFPCLFGCGNGAVGFSCGKMSITMQVVSSRSPFAPTASWNQNKMCKTQSYRRALIARECCQSIYTEIYQSYCTLTIWAAAASGGIPRQQSRAASADKASHTPSLDMITLPPAVDNCKKKKI